jgi:hypothetical protein
MPYLCLIEPDVKTAAQIGQIIEPFLKEKNSVFLHGTTAAELEEKIQIENKTNEPTLLLIVAVELNNLKNDYMLRDLKEKFKTDLVAVAFEDTKCPEHLITSLPVENIIYKPLDAAIMFEHIRFAMTKSDIVKTTAVHSLSEKCEIEKIRRFELIGLSDFGFICKTASKIEIGQYFKFYHPLFQSGTAQSSWARLVATNDQLMYFIYCCPNLTITNLLRKRVADSKNKLKSIKWKGFQHAQPISNPTIHICLSEAEEKQKLLDYFQRKFPKVKVVDWKPNPKEPKAESQLLITDQAMTKKNLEQYFTKTPLVFSVSPLPKDRKEIQGLMEIEAARIQFPIDRNFIGKIITSYFPDTEELDPSITTWIGSDSKILNSTLIEVTQLSEAAFVYNRTPILDRGSIQEFAIPEDDENELSPILAKTQFTSDKPGQDQTFTHQIVFYGIRDTSLKKLRLWMRLRHIQSQSQNQG